MAEVEAQIYVVGPGDDIIDKVEALFNADNESDFREIAASLGAKANDKLPLDPRNFDCRADLLLKEALYEPRDGLGKIVISPIFYVRQRVPT